MKAIYKREVSSYFNSMIGWIFVAVLTVFIGIYFFAYNLFQGYPYFSLSLGSSLFIFMVVFLSFVGGRGGLAFSVAGFACRSSAFLPPSPLPPFPSGEGGKKESKRQGRQATRKASPPRHLLSLPRGRGPSQTPKFLSPGPPSPWLPALL